MKDLFFYGTLRHLPLLELVLGHSRAEVIETTLRGASVTWVQDMHFPMIRLGTTASASGLLARNLSHEDEARLDFYEGGFGYALSQVETEAGPAKVYVPGPEVGPPGDSFELADWVRDHGALSLEAAREIMQHYGQRSSEDVARMSGAIRTRAGARLRAATAPTGRVGRAEITYSSIPYATFFALKDVTLQAETFAGTPAVPLKRAVFLGMDASVVLPYDPVRDRVLLVEQVRLGPIGRGDAGAWQLEPVAGHVDPGETPEDAARREALEEAGLTLRQLETVAECYPSPGAFSEFIYIYVGIADLPDNSAGIAGMATEGEDIRSHLVSFDDLMTMCETRGASTAPLILATYWLAHHRERLRNA